MRAEANYGCLRQNVLEILPKTGIFCAEPGLKCTRPDRGPEQVLIKLDVLKSPIDFKSFKVEIGRFHTRFRKHRIFHSLTFCVTVTLGIHLNHGTYSDLFSGIKHITWVLTLPATHI